MQKYPVSAAMNRLDAVDRTAATWLAPVFPAVDRSPLSAANKAAVKSRPIGWLLDTLDAPARDLVVDIVAGAVAYSGVHSYRFGNLEAQMDLDQPADVVYSPDALSLIKRIRAVNAYMVLCVRNPRALGVGWVRSLEKRGQNAVEKVQNALAFASQMAQAGWSSAMVTDFTAGVRDASAGAFTQSVNAIRSGVDAGAAAVRELLSRLPGLGEPATVAVVVGLVNTLAGLATTALATAGTISVAVIKLLSDMKTQAAQQAMATASAKERSELISKGILPAGTTQMAPASWVPGVPNLALVGGAAAALFLVARK